MRRVGLGAMAAGLLALLAFAAPANATPVARWDLTDAVGPSSDPDCVDHAEIWLYTEGGAMSFDDVAQENSVGVWTRHQGRLHIVERDGTAMDLTVAGLHDNGRVPVAIADRDDRGQLRSYSCTYRVIDLGVRGRANHAPRYPGR